MDPRSRNGPGTAAKLPVYSTQLALTTVAFGVPQPCVQQLSVVFKCYLYNAMKLNH
jgi:hypothetical protein